MVQMRAGGQVTLDLPRAALDDDLRGHLEAVLAADLVASR
jgi:hypothetical protein